MQTELEILRDVTSRLSEAGIEYMLTGSFALKLLCPAPNDPRY